ncbi:ABC transporter ATP-binding protein [Bizionia sediminis]|uniref:ABC transporter ATP-binding protein n=1 Tax=Bizionia sediminis TaxID=1737064 RepID=A0ABW5KRP0_9FLAO
MLQVTNLSFSYQQTPILKAITLQAKAGEHLAVIGESGSGKSTLLKLLYGEFDANSGTIFWKNTEILGPKYNLVVGYDFMKYVAQEFDLMPYTTVSENIGKHLSNFYPEKKQARINELLDLVELHTFAKTKVKLLSGGQKQRVALARALAQKPEILLLDEPFSHIDNYQKQRLRRRIFRFLKKEGITCVVATHDRDDVLGFADNMVVLNNQTIAAKGQPINLYNNPKSDLIAAFFGEFNKINKQYVYAHQLQVVAHSDMRVCVKQAYFKGAYYLIEAQFNNTPILFEHATHLAPNDYVFLEIITE